jgi:hypothetical protein
MAVLATPAQGVARLAALASALMNQHLALASHVRLNSRI